jgi:hypothetical protein
VSNLSVMYVYRMDGYVEVCGLYMCVGVRSSFSHVQPTHPDRVNEE